LPHSQHRSITALRPFTWPWAGSELQTQFSYVGGTPHLSHILPLPFWHSGRQQIILLGVRVVTWRWNSRESNLWPLDRKSDAATITLPRHLNCTWMKGHTSTNPMRLSRRARWPATWAHSSASRTTLLSRRSMSAGAGIHISFTSLTSAFNSDHSGNSSYRHSHQMTNQQITAISHKTQKLHYEDAIQRLTIDTDNSSLQFIYIILLSIQQSKLNEWRK